MLRKIVSIVTALTLTLFIAAPAALAVSDATASEVIESGGVTKVAASSDADTIYSLISMIMNTLPSQKPHMKAILLFTDSE